MTIAKANAKEKLGELFAFPLLKRMRKQISRFLFVIIFVWMIGDVQDTVAHHREELNQTHEDESAGPVIALRRIQLNCFALSRLGGSTAR